MPQDDAEARDGALRVLIVDDSRDAEPARVVREVREARVGR